MSQVPVLIDALVSRLSTAEELAGVPVLDGPEVTGQDADDWVLVGYNGDPDGEFQAAVSQQEWDGMGVSRSETIQLPVVVIVRRGDTDVRAARQRVYEVGGVVSALLQATPQMGVPQAQVAISASQLHQEQTDHGVVARLVFTLTCDTFT